MRGAGWANVRCAAPPRLEGGARRASSSDESSKPVVNRETRPSGRPCPSRAASYPHTRVLPRVGRHGQRPAHQQLEGPDRPRRRRRRETLIHVPRVFHILSQSHGKNSEATSLRARSRSSRAAASPRAAFTRALGVASCAERSTSSTASRNSIGRRARRGRAARRPRSRPIQTRGRPSSARLLV